MESAEKPVDMTDFSRFVDQRIQEAFQKNPLWNKLIVEAAQTKSRDQLIAALAAKNGTTPDDTLWMAITLYDVAMEALEQGQRLILVDQDYGFVREVTGLVKEPTRAVAIEKVAG